jgi:hypothetical protein
MAAEEMLIGPGSASSGEAAEHWRAGEAKLYESMALLFKNEFEQSDALLKLALDEAEKEEAEAERQQGPYQKNRARTDATGDFFCDMRGPFALLRALTALLTGLASFENDQIQDCLERLLAAEAVAGLDKREWVGKTLVQGICTLLAGIMQCTQHQFGKGVWNVFCAWRSIKVADPTGIEFKGKERTVVRSTSLLIVGAYHLLTSMMPPKMLRVASGILGDCGDREYALANMQSCWREDGVWACFGALVYASFMVDTRSFLNEPLTAVEIANVNEIMAWAKQKYPGSIFFAGVQANVFAMRQDIASAIACIQEVEQLATKLPGVGFVLYFKMGVYNMAKLDFGAAASALRSAVQAHKSHNRRAMVPYLSLLAAYCEWQTSNYAGVQELLEQVKEYSEKPKKDWGRQDKYAFKVAGKFGAISEGSWVPAKVAFSLAFFETITFRLRCPDYMPDAERMRFVELVEQTVAPLDRGSFPEQEGEASVFADYTIRAHCIAAAVLLQGKRYEDCAKKCEAGFAFKDHLTTEGQAVGSVPWLWYLTAQVHESKGEIARAEGALKEVEKFGKDYEFYPMLSFKVAMVEKRLGLTAAEVYSEVCVASGKAEELRFIVDPKYNPIVTWDFSVADYTIDFRARFEPPSGEPVEVAVAMQHAAESPAYEGRFIPEEHGIVEKGILVLTFDNSFSYWRSKTVRWRLDGAVLESEQAALDKAFDVEDVEID